MAIGPEIVDEEVMEDQIYVLPEKSWLVSIFQQKEVYRDVPQRNLLFVSKR